MSYCSTPINRDILGFNMVNGILKHSDSLEFNG